MDYEATEGRGRGIGDMRRKGEREGKNRKTSFPHPALVSPLIVPSPK
jgi:hypothetical protein